MTVPTKSALQPLTTTATVLVWQEGWTVIQCSAASDQFAYAKTRVAAGFMQKWLDLDLKTFAWRNLVGEKADIRHWELVRAIS